MKAQSYFQVLLLCRPKLDDFIMDEELNHLGKNEVNVCFGQGFVYHIRILKTHEL